MGFIYIFDIYDIDNRCYLTPRDRWEIVKDLWALGYTGKHVPILNDHFRLPTDDISELIKLADGESINHRIREGLVYKRLDGKFSFKTISNQFLLKEKD